MYASVGILLLLLVSVGLCDDFESLGCFKQSSIASLLSSKGSYIYQTSSYCWSQCPSDKVAALLDGKYCYCGSTVPSSDLIVDDSNCNTPCQGYGSQTCGGSGYFQVFVNGDVAGSSMAESTSSSATSSSSESSSSSKTTSSKSSSSKTQSSTTSSSSSIQSTEASSSTPNSSSQTAEPSSSSAPASTIENSASDSASDSALDSASDSATSSKASKTKGSVTTIVSTVTSSPNGSTNSVIEITTTVGSHSTGSKSTPSSSSSDAGSPPSQSKSLSGGKIAGAVVGSVAGVALISGLIFLLLHWKRNRSYDDDDDFFDIGGKTPGQFDSVAPNAFLGGAAGAGVVGHAHHSSNTTRSYSTNNDDGMFYDNHASDMNHDAFPSEEEYGRRRLSNGSLPDMVTRNPGSLKVVN